MTFTYSQEFPTVNVWLSVLTLPRCKARDDMLVWRASLLWFSWEWSGSFYEIQWVTIVVEEPLQVRFLLPTSL